MGWTWAVVAAFCAALGAICSFPTHARAGTPLAVERVAFGFAFPVFATSPPGDTTRFFICEQHTGRIKILNLATRATNAVPFMTQSGVAQGGEQGLLGLAFHPQYAAMGGSSCTTRASPTASTC